jgi:hypothetical protein
VRAREAKTTKQEEHGQQAREAGVLEIVTI